MVRVLLPLAVLAAVLYATPSLASAMDLTSMDTLSGVATAGFAVDSGEPTWVHAGLGKLQSGQGQGVALANAILAWRPRLTDSVGALISVDAQSQGRPAAGLDEAYLTLKADPAAVWRVSGRAGLFFPPVSLEHDGSEWSVVRTLTPSAINSWIAEEVKTAGVEATLRGAVAGQPVALTLAPFEGNETSGTLLTFRGWALHDLRTTLNSSFELPKLPPMFVGGQATATRPLDEVDGRWGLYAKLEWTPIRRLSLSAFGYDNNGDRTRAVNGQYAWRTLFSQLAARWSVDADTEILAQAMTGEAAMGKPVAGQYPADIGFESAYALVSRSIGPGIATVRLEQFEVNDRSFKAFNYNGETGWAASAAWAQRVTPNLELVVESILVGSRRPDQARLGFNPTQDSAQTRAAVRVSF